MVKAESKVEDTARQAGLEPDYTVPEASHNLFTQLLRIATARRIDQMSHGQQQLSHTNDHSVVDKRGRQMLVDYRSLGFPAVKISTPVSVIL